MEARNRQPLPDANNGLTPPTEFEQKAKNRGIYDVPGSRHFLLFSIHHVHSILALEGPEVRPPLLLGQRVHHEQFFILVGTLQSHPASDVEGKNPFYCHVFWDIGIDPVLCDGLTELHPNRDCCCVSGYCARLVRGIVHPRGSNGITILF